MKDHTRTPSPWGNYGFVVRRSVDNQIHHRTFPAKAGRDTAEVIEAARQAAVAYDRSLCQLQREARERRRRTRASSGLSPVTGINVHFTDRAWGREREHRAFVVRRMRDGDLHEEWFSVHQYGERGA